MGPSGCHNTVVFLFPFNVPFFTCFKLIVSIFIVNVHFIAFFHFDSMYPPVRARQYDLPGFMNRGDVVAAKSIEQVVLMGARTDGYVESIRKKVCERFVKSENRYGNSKNQN